MIDLDAIEARARAATEGPWTVDDSMRGVEARADIGGVEVVSWTGRRDASFIAHARQDIPVLIAEVRHLRAALATSLPTRIDAPDGHTAEVVSVRVRRATPTGGSWHESMSVERWRRQGNVREELRDSGGGGDREV